MSTAVLVAGGGPTGLATAVWAARSGMAVTLIEPCSGVVDKACGEGLMPAGVDALRRLGIAPEPLGRPFRGIRYIDGARRAEADFGAGPGLGIRRLALHNALLDAADAAGVNRISGRVKTVAQSADTTRVGLTDGRSFTADWLFAADGLKSPIRQMLGLDLPPRRPRRFGVRRHFQIAPWSDFVEVYWRPGAEAYVTPVSEREVGVAILVTGHPPRSPGQSPYGHLLDGFHELRGRLSDAPPASPLRGAGPFETRVLKRVHGRILLVGDAAGYLDPLTGEGLKLGFLGAEAAVAAVAAGTPERWEADWRRITRRYYLGTLGLLALTSRPRLRAWMVPTLQKAPWLMRVALRLLG